ncbi:hypothetical protein GGF32_005192 [Allomyces javanicus]|nr:hypothetical protein GGF32_005192 [Allomyces javanicus]
MLQYAPVPVPALAAGIPTPLCPQDDVLVSRADAAPAVPADHDHDAEAPLTPSESVTKVAAVNGNIATATSAGHAIVAGVEVAAAAVATGSMRIATGSMRIAAAARARTAEILFAAATDVTIVTTDCVSPVATGVVIVLAVCARAVAVGAKIVPTARDLAALSGAAVVTTGHPGAALTRAEFIPQMIQFVGKLSDGLVSGHAGLTRDRLLLRVIKSIVPLPMPQHMHLDEEWARVSFWLPHRPGIVGDMMRHSGIIIGGSRVEFEPADPHDALAADLIPPGRPVFVLLYMPPSRFDMLVKAMERANLVADIDLQHGHSIGQSRRIQYGYLTLAPSSPQRDAAQCLDGIDLAGFRIRVFPLSDPKAMFADPGRLAKVLDEMVERAEVSS